jgi:MFS family permease
MLGGVGNGVQWVAMVSAVQELTAANMQARVMSVLESSGAAMPGVGYVLGGAVAAAQDPRATFYVAGAGVLAITAVAAPVLGSSWPAGSKLNADDEVMVELIPAVPADRRGSPTWRS